jgi:2-keto-4-pentenoate hydratase
MTISTAAADLGTIADDVILALASHRQIRTFSSRLGALTPNDAYHVSALANDRRVALGYKPLGRKAGFTNRNIWDEYGVRAPNWGYVYDRTLHELDAPLPLAHYCEPKIEPEIVFGLAVAPSPGMDDAALMSCIEWVAHGYEIVQSIFPGWKFSAADSVAANAMHGALLIGPRHGVGTSAADWLRALPKFEIELYCDGHLTDRGHGSNVLEGPVSVVRHVVDLLADDPDNPPLAAGEIISTGTLTRALPVRAGQTWTTKLKGIALEGISLRFC